VGLQTETRRPLRHGDKVLLNGAEVGEVTSGGFSPMLECGIALAYVSAEAARAGALDIQSKTATQPARVVKPPFVKTSLSKN
jgi:aminomethyltransferase